MKGYRPNSASPSGANQQRQCTGHEDMRAAILEKAGGKVVGESMEIPGVGQVFLVHGYGGESRKHAATGARSADS